MKNPNLKIEAFQLSFETLLLKAAKNKQSAEWGCAPVGEMRDSWTVGKTREEAVYNYLISICKSFKKSYQNKEKHSEAAFWFYPYDPKEN